MEYFNLPGQRRWIGKGESQMRQKNGWKIVTIGLILMMLFLASFVFADAEQVITMDQAVEMALKSDPQVFNARNTVETSKLAVKQQVLKTWPQATITDTYGDVLQNPMTTNNPLYNEFTPFPNMLNVTVTETIPTNLHLYGVNVPTSIEAAIWTQVNNEAQYQITQANTIYNAISLYLTALKDGELVDYQEGVVQSSRISVAIAQEQLRQNKLSQPDELNVENTLANNTYTLEMDRSNYNLALQQLANQIGLKDITGLKLQEPSLAVAQQIPDAQQIKASAVQKRLEMKQAEVTVLKAAQQLAQDQNQVLPDLNFGYNFHNSDGTESLTIGYSFLSGNISGNAQDVAGDTSFIQSNQNYSNLYLTSVNEFTLKLTWNLDFGTNQNQVQQDRFTLVSAKSSSDQTKIGVEWDVDQAAANFILELKKVAVSRQAVPYYQKELDIVKLEFKQGKATQLDITNAENNLLQAQNQAKSDEYDKLLAYKKLLMVSGDLYPFNVAGQKSK